MTVPAPKNISDEIDLKALYEKYGEEKVNEAVAYLTYKKTDITLPKDEDDNYPTLYIFRHGQSEDNEKLLFSGWRDIPITNKGMEQALEIARKIKDKKIDMLISSTQIRAVDTMKIAICLNDNARTLEIEQDERIKEKSYGDWQGESKIERHLQGPEELKKVRRTFEGKAPNGESVKEVCERVADFCDEIIPLMKEHNINVAISCHGNSIRGFRNYFEDLTPEEVATVETPLGKDYAAYTLRD